MARTIRSFDPRRELPDNRDELIGLSANELYGKKILLLFDTRGHSAQIEALVPPASCALVTTSRTRMAVPGLYTHSVESSPRKTVLPSRGS